MRTFIIRARKGTTRWDKLRSQLGGKEHFEVVAHSVINAFFLSNDFRMDVEVYIVLESSADFPKTIRLSGNEGLSLAGFHEEAVVQLLEQALKNSANLIKDQSRSLAPGVTVYGFGFDRLVSNLIQDRTLYILSPKGEDIRTSTLDENPVFILSDHLTMPKKSLNSLKSKGLKQISLGKKMLFASQCVVLLNHEFDYR